MKDSGLLAVNLRSRVVGACRHGDVVDNHLGDLQSQFLVQSRLVSVAWKQWPCQHHKIS